MISEDLTTDLVISLDDSFPDSTSQFLKPFENLEIESIHEGMSLNFEIAHTVKRRKKCPILKLAQPKDAFEIVKIYKDLYNGTYPYKEMEDVQEVQKMIMSPNCEWVVFKDIDDNIMGCFTFLLDFEDKMGYIRGLMLKRQYQGSVDVIKAVIGSYIGMYRKYENRIYRWYCENRTAHAKSQFALSIGGIRPLAFYPNKDIFLGKVESDILHICYDKRAITTMRSCQTPIIIPEAVNCFKYSTNRYHLGPYKIANFEKLNLDNYKIQLLKKSLIKQLKVDKFGYKTIRFTLKGSDSYFEFLYTPQIQNFEKTSYNVNSLEELYLFIEQFIEYGQKLGIRYYEIFISAYKPKHQKLFYMFGLEPRGYLPSWKYNKVKNVFEDFILFNYFEGEISEDIKLIDEGKELLEMLGLQYVFQPKSTSKEISSSRGYSRENISKIWSRTKFFKSTIIIGMTLYFYFLFIGLGVAVDGCYNIILNTISQLGTHRIIPFPFFFDISCIFGGITTILVNYYLSKSIKASYQQNTSSNRFYCKLHRFVVVVGVIGSFGIIMIGVFSLDRAFGALHSIFSLIAFGGFIISLLGLGIIIF